MALFVPIKKMPQNVSHTSGSTGIDVCMYFKRTYCVVCLWFLYFIYLFFYMDLSLE